MTVVTHTQIKLTVSCSAPNNSCRTEREDLSRKGTKGVTLGDSLDLQAVNMAALLTLIIVWKRDQNSLWEY